MRMNLRSSSENKQEKTAKGTETLGSNPTSVKNGCMVLDKLFNLSVPQLPHLGNNLCCACLTRFGIGRNKMMGTKQIEQMSRVLLLFCFILLLESFELKTWIKEINEFSKPIE